ncbi:MAG: site-2 protease family protein [Lachnospiraceae bacterium]|nr:site-2 protease family protein [Lachnospiraceae bacterium]
MTNDSIQKVLVRLLAIVICFPVHESAHAWVADKLGDPTGKAAGRISLNPMVHMELFGTLCFLLLGIGYAKPVPVNMSNFKSPKRDFALTALAGPLSNLIMAVIFLLILKLMTAAGFPSPAFGILAEAMIYAAYINISLAVFNMIPVPPLDGSRLVTAVLPDRLYGLFLKYERYSAFALLIVIFILNGAGISPISYATGAVFKAVAGLLRI